MEKTKTVKTQRRNQEANYEVQKDEDEGKQDASTQKGAVTKDVSCQNKYHTTRRKRRGRCFVLLVKVIVLKPETNELLVHSDTADSKKKDALKGIKDFERRRLDKCTRSGRAGNKQVTSRVRTASGVA